MNKLYQIGSFNDYTGWGIITTYLNLHLKEFCDVIFLESPNNLEVDAPVFMPIPLNDLAPHANVKSPRMIGYCFLELPLYYTAAENVKKYYWIFGGSNWTTQKLLPITTNTSTLVQGVDFDRFKTQEYRQRDGFRVFSGGKFEFRKGQDIVITVMREFMAKHEDVLLVTSWYNEWEETKKTMEESNLIDTDNPLKGLPMDRVFQKPRLSNKLMSILYGETDIGLFPNRAEGGTNLVLMEYMRSSRPVIASYATGQMDVLNGEGPLKITKGVYDQLNRFHPNLSCIYDKLEEAYQNREKIKEDGFFCQKLIEPFTWREMARKIAEVAFG